MKLSEALDILNRPVPEDAAPMRVLLACGFAPLHLHTYLGAHLRERLPGKRVEIRTGLFEDLAGTLEAAPAQAPDAAAVVVEWPDLDPRLGVRRLGGWGPSVTGDIEAAARAGAARLRGAMEALAARCPVALSLPTLAIPPVSSNAGWQAGSLELSLRALVAELGQWAGGTPGIRVLNQQRLDRLSPPAERFDVRTELAAGFPYTLRHAEALAGLLATLAASPAPKKGLITDLDETLWDGILGEAGPAGVSWDLEHHSQPHGLYQQVLGALADSGVLVAVASKNDPALVEEVFRRSDLLVRPEQIFPVQVHWGAKSRSVGEILRVWNVGADSVVFVDDSPMELAEVREAHSGIECLAFPDHGAIWDFLERLRDLFGKSSVSEEDRLRLESIRRSAAAQAAEAAPAEVADAFLAQAGATVTIHFTAAGRDSRALELINKTNQFNLNGRRYGEAEWKRLFDRPGAWAAIVSYRDKFGPLGKIAVLSGLECGDRFTVENWVMSCRAFARRIEHQCLRQLFRRFPAEVLAFDYRETERNGPLRRFFESMLGRPPCAGSELSREQFEAACPELFHAVETT